MMRINQSGMTLVEVMVGALLVAVLAAAIAGIGSMVSDGMKTTMDTQDQFSIANQIRTMFENEQSCRLALGGPMAYGGAAASSPFSQIVNVAGTTNIRIHQPIQTNAAGARIVFLDPGSVALRTLAGKPTQEPANRVGNWFATAMTIQPATGTFTGAGYFPALVRINLRKVKEASTTTPNLGSYNIPDIALTVQLDAARNIISCFPANFATDGQPAPVCAPGFAPTTQANVLGVATASGPFLVCRRIVCPFGSVATGGWDTYGNINCFP